MSLYNARALLGPPFRAGFGAQVAQLVEHVTENHGVGGSIPPLGTTHVTSMPLDEVRAYLRPWRCMHWTYP